MRVQDTQCIGIVDNTGHCSLGVPDCLLSSWQQTCTCQLHACAQTVYDVACEQLLKVPVAPLQLHAGAFMVSSAVLRIPNRQPGLWHSLTKLSLVSSLMILRQTLVLPDAVPPQTPITNGELNPSLLVSRAGTALLRS